jgi:rsbT antagonist protein RsbS
MARISFLYRMALTLQEELSNRIVKDKAKGVIIDISGLEMVDSFIGRVLGTISGIARLLDAQTVLVGMRPTVAMTLLELGIQIKHMKTALNVEDGIDLLNKTLAKSRSMRLKSPGANRTTNRIIAPGSLSLTPRGTNGIRTESLLRASQQFGRSTFKMRSGKPSESHSSRTPSDQM